MNICAYVPDTYQDAINYAIAGAEMAHQAGDILQEAGFYFESGKVMERLQQGSGIEYMNRSLDIYRQAARPTKGHPQLLCPLRQFHTHPANI